MPLGSVGELVDARGRREFAENRVSSGGFSAVVVGMPAVRREVIIEPRRSAKRDAAFPMPGPLLRIPQGTEIDATIANHLYK